MYVLLVEPVCSMIINDNVQIFDFFFELLPQPLFESFIEKIGIKLVLDLIIDRTAGKWLFPYGPYDMDILDLLIINTDG